MKLATLTAALIVAPFIIEALPQDVVNALANVTMVGLCLTGFALTLWVGFKK